MFSDVDGFEFACSLEIVGLVAFVVEEELEVVVEGVGGCVGVNLHNHNKYYQSECYHI